MLALDGTLVFTIPELWVLMRRHALGDKLAVEFVRDGERLAGSGVL